MAGPQVSFGQALAWGQYVIGIGPALLVLKPFFRKDLQTSRFPLVSPTTRLDVSE